MVIRPTRATLAGPDTSRPIWWATPTRVAVQVEQLCTPRLAGSIRAHSRRRLTHSGTSVLMRFRRSATGTWTSHFLDVSPSWAKDDDLSFVHKRSIYLIRSFGLRLTVT